MQREASWGLALVRSRAFRRVLRWGEARSWRGRLVALWRSELAAWREAFAVEGAAIVLARLERFCHANSTTYVEGDDGRASAQLEGRRQVWLLVRGYLRLTDDQLEAMRLEAATQEGEWDA